MRILASVYEPRIPPGPSGGLFLIDGDVVTQVDDVPSTGVCFAGDRLVRARWGRACCETTFDVWDAEGTSTLFLVDAGDPHEIAWSGTELVVIASKTNEVIWTGLDGKESRRWQASTVENSWHLSGVTCVDDGTVFSAFGRHETARAWQGNADPVGFLHHIERGEDVLSGIRSPHSPALIDGTWWCCESLDRSLVRGDERIEADGWARGLAVTDDHVVVGVSAFRERLAPFDPANPRITVPPRAQYYPRVEFRDRATAALVRSVELPVYGDVFAVVVVPDGVGWL